MIHKVNKVIFKPPITKLGKTFTGQADMHVMFLKFDFYPSLLLVQQG